MKSGEGSWLMDTEPISRSPSYWSDRDKKPSTVVALEDLRTGPFSPEITYNYVYNGSENYIIADNGGNNGHVQTSNDGFLTKARSISGLLWIFGIFILFSFLYCLFIYFVLIRRIVIVGSTIFDASTTNLLVSIFSQVSALLSDTALRNVLSSLRVHWAASPTGTSAFTWYGLGPSSQWWSTAQLTVASYMLNAWCMARLGLPLLNLGFGSVLKFQADFEYYFVPGTTEMPVFAGLVPIDIRLVDMLQAAELAQYYTTWSSSLQSNSRYAIETRMEGCETDCRALIWPGGLQTVRQISNVLNSSIMHDGIFKNDEAIKIEDAPGFITTFSGLSSNFTFDVEKECALGGQLVDDGIKICVKQVGLDVAVGWSTCPQAIFDAKKCDIDEGWKQDEMKSQTMMSAYKQFATTTYSRANLSILHVEPIDTPQQIKLNGTDYLKIFKTLLIPKPGGKAFDNTSIASLTYTIGWAHRVYGEFFQDEDGTLISTLQNMMAIPFQFGITAKQQANHTLTVKPNLIPILGDFAVPDEMRAMAKGGSSSQRLRIQNWTGWAFIAGDLVVFLLVLAGIFTILRTHRPLPMSTSLTELDALVDADRLVCIKEGEKISLSELPVVVETRSPMGLARSLRPWRMKYKD
ncbi:unnamed protein product [Clonostachys byssicola]|uniref:Uncharacterized protein n=1 Tax=Clonostachys byssicola TaxID=160290 RepID=A0A9N9UKV8_9HYPO|nr:unnamed protein product [Clonostachys byssicola]